MSGARRRPPATAAPPRPAARARASTARRDWARRLRAADFRRRLTDAVGAELVAIGRLRVGELIDPQAVRTVIAAWDIRVVDRGAVAEVAAAANRRGARRLARRRERLADLLDAPLLAELDAAVATQLELTPRTRAVVAALMESEFISRLFTDLIFTALMSFQRKANPLFGAFAVRALEEQIKGFIRLFMPMLQAQATAFAVDPANQRAAVDFARALLRQLLAQPVGHWAALAEGRGAGSFDALLRRAAASPALAALLRGAAVAVWDDFFAAAKDRRIDTLLRVDTHAAWLAARIVDALLPLLRRDAIVAFVADELGR